MSDAAEGTVRSAGQPRGQPGRSDAALGSGADPEGAGGLSSGSVAPAGAFGAGRHALQASLAATIAFGVTVAPAALGRGSSGLAIVTALVALGAGVGGPVLAERRRALGRFVGVVGFVTACLCTWLLSSAALAPARLDPIRAAIGGLAWGAFALSWSDRWHRAPPPAVDATAPLLTARSSLPPLAVVIGGVGVLVGLVLVALPWRVRDAERAVVAHAVAVTAATAVVTAAATVAIARGKRHQPARRINSTAGRALLLLVVAAVVGAVVMAVR